MVVLLFDQESPSSMHCTDAQLQKKTPQEKSCAINKEYYTTEIFGLLCLGVSMWALRGCEQVWRPPALSCHPSPTEPRHPQPRGASSAADRHRPRQESSDLASVKRNYFEDNSVPVPGTAISSSPFYKAPLQILPGSGHCTSCALFRLRMLIKLLFIFRFSSWDFTPQTLLTLCLGTSKLFTDQSN